MIAETGALVRPDIAAFVARTAAASGVPARVEDVAAIEQLATLLRPDAQHDRGALLLGRVQVHPFISTDPRPNPTKSARRESI